MRTLTFALLLTVTACAEAAPVVKPTPAPDPGVAAKEPVSEAVTPVEVAAKDPAEPVLVAANDPAPQPKEVAVAVAKDAGVKPSPAKDAGVAAKDAGVALKGAAKDAGTALAVQPGVRDAGTVKAVVVVGPVAAPDKKTERLWKSKCGACHGLDGKAATEKGRKMKMSNLTLASWQKSHTDDEIRKAIVDGRDVKKDGVEQQMDAFGPELDAEQLAALISYVRWVGAAH